MAKPINAIYLDDNLNYLETEKNPTVVKFPTDIEPYQNMMIWVQNEDGSLSPKYQIPANGEDGFPLVMNKKPNEIGAIYLNPGDVCRLEFQRSNRFTGVFTLPTKGNK